MNLNVIVLLFYPTYFRVIMNFYCIIDLILHHIYVQRLEIIVFNNLS